MRVRSDDPSTHEAATADDSTLYAARVYDYFLGGKTNWAIDRMLGDQPSAMVPIIRTGATRPILSTPT